MSQAYLAQYQGRTFDAYEHFLKADQQRIAHDIAVNELASDAVIRGDLGLLRALFQPFDPVLVDDWTFRGKVSTLIGLKYPQLPQGVSIALHRLC